jgi:hypothetical protein
MEKVKKARSSVATGLHLLGDKQIVLTFSGLNPTGEIQ